MYNILPVGTTLEDIVVAARLLKKVFPKSGNFTEAYVNWEYTQNPAGNILGFNAWAGEDLAAHYVTQPMFANMEGKTVKGLLSLNTATHPSHQGKKLFTTLAEKTYEKAAAEGFEFVVGVANANSTPGFINKLGFVNIGGLHAKIGTGRIFRCEKKTDAGYERHWDRKSLTWRLANPNVCYSIIGNTVYGPTGTLGIKAIMGEFGPEITGTHKDLTTGMGLNPLRLWMGIDPDIDWEKSRYRDIPERFRPSPLNLIYKDLTGIRPAPSRETLRFRAIDFDAY
jgi:hypothetical protein